MHGADPEKGRKKGLRFAQYRMVGLGWRGADGRHSTRMMRVAVSETEGLRHKEKEKKKKKIKLLAQMRLTARLGAEEASIVQSVSNYGDDE